MSKLPIVDVLAGHDPLDSTTVSEPFDPVVLPENASVKGLKIGIPKVFSFSITSVITFRLNIFYDKY